MTSAADKSRCRVESVSVHTVYAPDAAAAASPMGESSIATHSAAASPSSPAALM